MYGAHGKLTARQHETSRIYACSKQRWPFKYAAIVRRSLYDSCLATSAFAEVCVDVWHDWLVIHEIILAWEGIPREPNDSSRSRC